MRRIIFPAIARWFPRTHTAGCPTLTHKLRVPHPFAVSPRKGGRPRTPTFRRFKSRSPFPSLPSRQQPSKEAPNNALKNSCEPPIPPPSTAFLAPFRRIAGRLLTFYQAPSHVAPQVDISWSFKPRQLPLSLTRRAALPPFVFPPQPQIWVGPILRMSFSKPKVLPQSMKPSPTNFVCPLIPLTLPVAAWVWLCARSSAVEVEQDHSLYSGHRGAAAKNENSDALIWRFLHCPLAVVDF